MTGAKILAEKEKKRLTEEKYLIKYNRKKDKTAADD